MNLGIDLLFIALAERLGTSVVEHQLNLPPQAGKLRGELFKLNCITNESYDEEGYCHLEVKLPSREWERLLKSEHSEIAEFIEH